MAIDDVHAGSAHHYYAHASNDTPASERGVILVVVFVVASVALSLVVGYQLVKKEREDAEQRKLV